MTRCRAVDGNSPNALMAEYYGQRVSAGLIIAAGTSTLPNGLGYARIPGLFSGAQTRAWKRVTDAVHAKGGKTFVQLPPWGTNFYADFMPWRSRAIPLLRPRA
jgi:N-ethylmaleimide reductase